MSELKYHLKVNTALPLGRGMGIPVFACADATGLGALGGGRVADVVGAVVFRTERSPLKALMLKSSLCSEMSVMFADVGSGAGILGKGCAMVV
jgi:hypothetical protein